MVRSKKFIFGSLMVLVGLTLAVGDASVEKGKEIYDNYCFSCHGEKGDGLKDRGIDFSDPDFWVERTDEDMEEVIENGKGSMPAWKGTLSSDDIDSVIVYMRTFSNQVPSVTETPNEESEGVKETPRTQVETKSQPGFEVILAFLAVLGSVLLLKRK